MRRRDVIASLAGAAAWPLAARGQPSPPMPTIGFLNSSSPGPWQPFVSAFHKGLNETGYVEGRNIAVEYRWAEGHYDQLPKLAADLVRRNVAVIVSTGGHGPTFAATAATSTIPIVFTIGADPVKLGLVGSLNRPGGNVTGVGLFITQMASKRLGLLLEMVPKVETVAILLNPSNHGSADQLADAEQAARALNRRLHVLNAQNDAEIDAAFATMVEIRAGALLMGADPYLNGRREKVVALAARHSIPTIYEQREHAVAGGLMSYGTSLSDGYRQAGIYTGRILNGEKPADLPVMQAAKFEFVINLKTAKALGLDVPPTLSARADEVIE
jgi:putative ABC transport system substrate-binding protein